MSKKVTFTAAAALIAALFVLAGCSGEPAKAAPVPEETAQQPAPQEPAEEKKSGGSLVMRQGYELAGLSGETLEGERVTAAQLRAAELTVINVWTTTCPYCIEEMPDLEEVSQSVGEKGVQVIGIIGDGRYRPEDAAKLIERTGVTYLNVVPDKGFEQTILSIAYAVPTTLFVDRDGRMIGEPVIGKRDREFFLQEIDRRLSQL